MKDLIEALQIFSKYKNPSRPTHCEQDVLYISLDISPTMISEEDTKRLEQLGFFVTDGYFYSHRFGSC